MQWLTVSNAQQYASQGQNDDITVQLGGYNACTIRNKPFLGDVQMTQ